MTGLIRILLLLAAVCLIALSQQQKSPPNDIFSGTVSELSQEALTVVRKVPAKADVARRFVRDEQTKVEGSLRISAKVAVSYKADDEGQLHALHIIVR